MSDPRRVAFDVLRAVAAEGAYANLELARRVRGLSARDAAFATELAAGTLRMQGAYDAVVEPLVRGRLDPPVRDALRLGAHQLLSMRVPTHAAVGTTVALVKKAIGHRPSGLVNAVLRKVAARDLEQWMTALEADLATRTSHPQWIVDAFAQAWDADPTPILRADNVAPKVTLVARPGLATRAELGGMPSRISPLGVELPGGDPGSIRAVREGRAGVQDAGSQVLALALAAVAVEAPAGPAGRAPGEHWLDMCAGPGGKAALLQAIGDQRGATVLAAERQPHRAELVRKTGVRHVVVADGTRPGWGVVFDRVLVDAPCSGLGALRRRPEARWRKMPADLAPLVALQTALLHSAIDCTRPGGVIGYGTCSPVVSETAEVVRSVLQARSDVSLVPVPPLVDWIEDCESKSLPGALQLWPHLHGTDAMFLAVLRRR